MKKNNLLLIIAVFGLSFSSRSQSLPSYVPNNSIIGWWPFSGNANDESGNGLNGTVSGATLSNDRNGNSNEAYYFDGSGDQIITGASGNFSSDSLSISLWVRIVTQSVYHQIQIANNYNGPLVRGFAFNDSRIAYVPAQSDCSSSGTVGFSNSAISTNTWTHLVFTVNPSCTVIYINGSKVDSVSSGGIGCTSIMSLVLGNDIGGGASEWFNGYMDDIGLWRKVLSHKEVTNLYNACNISATYNQINSCYGGSSGTATVTAIGGSIPYTYSWAPSGGSTSTGTGLSAGNYTVTITDVNNCFITQTFAITNETTYTYSGNSPDDWLDQGNWSPCYPGNTISNGFTVFVSPGSELIIPSGATITNNGTLINMGSISNLGGTYHNNGVYRGNGIYSGSIFVNPAGGTVSAGD